MMSTPRSRNQEEPCHQSDVSNLSTRLQDFLQETNSSGDLHNKNNDTFSGSAFSTKLSQKSKGMLIDFSNDCDSFASSNGYLNNHITQTSTTIQVNSPRLTDFFANAISDKNVSTEFASTSSSFPSPFNYSVAINKAFGTQPPQTDKEKSTLFTSVSFHDL